MSSNTDTATVWYRNVAQGTLHEVEKGSKAEKRLRKEQREFFEDGDTEPSFEPAYERLSSADVKKAQENPEKQPGYPAAQEKARQEAEAEKARTKARNEALDAAISGQGSEQPQGGDSGQSGQQK